jgi:hypothetical protein
VKNVLVGFVFYEGFYFLENFEKKLLKKGMVFGLGSNVFICAKI